MPLTLTCTDCGESYLLKDEFAGKKVRCRKCDGVQVVPIEEIDYDVPSSFADEADGPPGLLHPSFQRDKFLLRQKVMTIGSKYVVTDEAQQPILFIERPAHLWRQIVASVSTALAFVVGMVVTAAGAAVMVEQFSSPAGAWAVGLLLSLTTIALGLWTAVKLWPKRHIEFYADETKAELLLTVLQDKQFELIRATFTVVRPDGEVLARMRKNYLTNIIRRKWDVYDPSGRLFLIAREDSLILSLLRRFLGPLFGILRTNFILVTPVDGRVERLLGEFNRKMTLFDRYVLDVSRDHPALIDRRVAVALGVLLDTGEKR